MRILALDTATLCGWAISPGTSGVCNLKPSPNQRPGARWQKLRALLKRTYAQFPDLELVVYEEPIPYHSSMQASALAHGYVAVIELWCADRGITCRHVHNSTIKKFVTGKGQAKKEEVIEAVRHHGFDPRDDNESDAIALLLWALQGQEL